MKRAAYWVLASTAIVLVLAAVVTLAWQRQGQDDFNVPAPLIAAAASPALVERGAYLARAGNCMACHSARGGVPYAG